MNFFTPEQLMKWDAEVAEPTELLWITCRPALGPNLIVFNQLTNELAGSFNRRTS